MKYSITFVILSLAIQMSAQFDGLVFDDEVYRDDIRAVEFHVTNLFTSYPVIKMRSDSSLTLGFDDMDDTPKYYRYKVIHCNADWTPSDLDETEYVDGYNDEPIDFFEYSINTKVNYAHYSLSLPNDDMQLTKSGNYLLVVYEENSDRPLVLSRRFALTEPLVSIRTDMITPASVSKLRTHQEIDFELDVKNIRIVNTKEDISVVVMQNGRWDNAISGIRSKFERGERMIFDYQDKIVFPAGKDFRNLDIRSTQYRSEDVFEILRYEDHIEVVCELDEPRTFVNYLNDKDIDGNFVILNRDDVRYNDLETRDLTAEYVDAFFTLDVDAPYDADVYIFGKLTDWKLKERFKMAFNDERTAYVKQVRLKQGFYDYIYVLANSDGTPDEMTIEGNWYEATNKYTVLVYYHPFGGRYDQLVGAKTIESGR